VSIFGEARQESASEIFRLPSIATAVLRDFSKSEAELKAAVTKVLELPSNTDGKTADRDNDLYMTALELNDLMRRNAETGKVTKYWSDNSVS
jgi:hypothetical protein